MEIRVRSTPSRSHPYRVRPIPDPLQLVGDREFLLYHSRCGGRVSIDSSDRRDVEAYATVRCNLCFEANREKQALIRRALTEVLVESNASEACTVLRFVPLSPREILDSPLAARLQRYLGR